MGRLEGRFLLHLFLFSGGAEEGPESEEIGGSSGDIRRWDIQNGADSDPVGVRSVIGPTP